MRVAFLGTGIMGAPMARHIAAAGHDVRAWNRTREKAEAIDGVDVADSPADAAEGADVVVTMLADGSAVESVVGDALHDGIDWLQMSTVGLSAGERLAELAAERGAVYVDAPVLGTKAPAEKGELIVIASGPADAIDRAEPLFDAVGSKIVRQGDAGEGQRLKLVLNNWVLSVTEAVAETIALAEALGADPSAFLETIAGGPLDSAYAQIKGKMIIERDFPASFPLALAFKDVGLVREAAERAGIDVPLAVAIAGQFERAIDAGHGDKDMSATVYASAPDA